MEQQTTSQEKAINFSSITSTAIQVITKPVSFFQQMPKTGGFVQPLVFMAVMGVVSALVGLILAILGLGSGGVGMAFAAIILTPIIIAIFGFVVAAVVFVIWKIMGSSEGYETAYRCVAYATAIVPLTTILGIIPYIGAILGLVWTTYLLVLASSEVHGIAAKKAWIGFGAVAAVLAIVSLSTEYAGRKMMQGLEGWQEQAESMDVEEMTPEDAGKMVGDFLKGFSEEGE
ncbi:MAG: YIP1 family protein [Desulfovibrionales bacterium]